MHNRHALKEKLGCEELCPSTPWHFHNRYSISTTQNVLRAYTFKGVLEYYHLQRKRDLPEGESRLRPSRESGTILRASRQLDAKHGDKEALTTSDDGSVRGTRAPFAEPETILE
jgi:hypothetical protein